jgi:hypothetical protein
MTIVVTHLQNTRQSARQIRVEPFGTVTAVNIQKAIEAAGGGGGGGGGTISPTLVTTTPYSPSVTDTLLFMAVGGPAVVNMPASSSRGGLPLVIKDVSGAADTNNITINRNGADTYGFDGQGTYTIMAAYGGARFDPKTVGATNGWALDP